MVPYRETRGIRGKNCQRQSAVNNENPKVHVSGIRVKIEATADAGMISKHSPLRADGYRRSE